MKFTWKDVDGNQHEVDEKVLLGMKEVNNMYESPIEIIQQDIANSIQFKLENDICNAIYSYGINVNKEELIKALAYDRNQYDKGYSEGHIDGVLQAEKLYARPQGKWICEDVLRHLYYCSECRNYGEYFQPYCAWCGAYMRTEEKHT